MKRPNVCTIASPKIENSSNLANNFWQGKFTNKKIKAKNVWFRQTQTREHFISEAAQCSPTNWEDTNQAWGAISSLRGLIPSLRIQPRPENPYKKTVHSRLTPARTERTHSRIIRSIICRKWLISYFSEYISGLKGLDSGLRGLFQIWDGPSLIWKVHVQPGWKCIVPQPSVSPHLVL